MPCECGRPGCSEIVLITLEEYAQLRTNSRHHLTEPEHAVDGATVDVKHDGYWLQRR